MRMTPKRPISITRLLFHTALVCGLLFSGAQISGAQTPATPPAPVPNQIVPANPTAPSPSPSTSPTPTATDADRSPDVATTPKPYLSTGLNASDQQALAQALDAAKAHNFTQAENLRQGLSDPTARKLVQWAIISNDGADIYGFAALDGARRDLWGWPKEEKRQIAAEKVMGTSGMAANQVIDWFTGAPPKTVDGATLLIRAYQTAGKTREAEDLARQWWRSQIFDAVAQDNFFQAFGTYLKPEDHKARLYLLLEGPQGASLTLLLSLSDDKGRQVAAAAQALRGDRAGASDLFNATIRENPHNPVLAFEGARFLRRHGLDTLGYGLLPDLPQSSGSESTDNALWNERLNYFRSALKNRDYVAAYHAMNKAGFDKGEKKAESEFFAGWIALTRLNRADEALAHFKAVKTAGTSPITQGRANYWIGRALEALDNGDDALLAYKEGAQYIYSFYGQLAAEKTGQKSLTIGKDPIPTADDRARFEKRDLVKAAKILGQSGNHELFRAIAIAVANNLPGAEEEALLYDMAQTYDTQDTASRMARISQQRGFYLPERAYPIRKVANTSGTELAFIYAITRQESGFDPNVRSRANAKGLMQLLPSTGRIIARRLGMSFSDSDLYDPEANMTLGAYFLNNLVERFGGSYIMAAAGYNAGPNRPASWSEVYAEPRGAKGDPLTFIESAPFSETRDYMMRVTENVRIYRARLNGGTAPLTAWSDIARGVVVKDVNDGELTGANASGPVSYNDLQKPSGDSAAAQSAPTNTDACTITTKVIVPPAKPVAPPPVPLDRLDSDTQMPHVTPPAIDRVKVSQCKGRGRHKHCKTVWVKRASGGHGRHHAHGHTSHLHGAKAHAKTSKHHKRH